MLRVRTVTISDVVSDLREETLPRRGRHREIMEILVERRVNE
jgi:hypothetical protein